MNAKWLVVALAVLVGAIAAHVFGLIHSVLYAA